MERADGQYRQLPTSSRPGDAGWLAGGVDIWVLPVAPLGAEARHGLLVSLSADEREKMQRFVTQHLQDQYLLARVLVRSVLAFYGSCRARDWLFVTDVHGRPHIATEQMPPEGLYFSLSHTEGCMLLAVSRVQQIGVDVENTARVVNAQTIASRFFSPLERAQLSQVVREEFMAGFWSLWVLKEAYVKARGLGMAIEFDSFGLVATEEGPRLAEGVEGARRDDWHFQRFTPSPSHVAAFCVGSEGIEPRFFMLHDLLTIKFAQVVFASASPALHEVLSY